MFSQILRPTVKMLSGLRYSSSIQNASKQALFGKELFQLITTSKYPQAIEKIQASEFKDDPAYKKVESHALEMMEIEENSGKSKIEAKLDKLNSKIDQNIKETKEDLKKLFDEIHQLTVKISGNINIKKA